MRVLLRTACLAALAAVLASCATRTAPPARAPRAAPPQVRVEAAASPADYVRTAGSIDLLAIRASEMAIARSSQHQSLARRLVTEHSGTSAQLSIAGRRLNLLPSAELLSVHQEQLAALDAAADFDRAYLLLMRTLHRRELALHEAFAERGSSPTLRAVARNAAAMARAHLALIGG